MQANERAIRERLESHTKKYEIGRELHDVPPHVTHEVRFGGKRAICKRATSAEGDPAMEARIMQFLEATTSVPVPHVLAVGEDYFVAEWDDAVPDDGSVNESGARTIGAGLATLHDEARFDSFGFLEAKDGELALNARKSWHETV
ncbi:hypothetical protein [Haladaptatus sp.]|uniref:hypothetical protein n=1 Tax=Haladaptatus sp. TaxID=1973141 RepID=UPI003C358541